MAKSKDVKTPVEVVWNHDAELLDDVLPKEVYESDSPEAQKAVDALRIVRSYDANEDNMQNGIIRVLASKILGENCTSPSRLAETLAMCDFH